jgi:hypothetical protein
MRDYISKVRARHEYVFIAKVTNADNIPEKSHFNFNHKLGPNNSDTKRTAVRKIKAYSMNLIAEIYFAIDNVKYFQQHRQIHYTLIGNQSIKDLFMYIVRVKQVRQYFISRYISFNHELFVGRL